MSGKPFVSVLGVDGRPLMPCTGKRARLLLTKSRAFVRRHIPFTIQLKDRNQDDCHLQPLQVKIDPGSVFTGLAVVRPDRTGEVAVISLYELEHRGKQISRKLKRRLAFRRARRSRKTRYRKARFLNRTRPEGWLPPSLQHRVDTTTSWVYKLMARYPVTSIWIESVKFDMQKLRNPDITNKEYRYGTLYAREMKEYLLEKWQHKCAYCDTQDVTRFEMDHWYPKSSGGSDAIGNRVLACHPCNQRKSNLPPEVFLSHDLDRYNRIKRVLKTSLKDAAAVNSTRNAIVSKLEATLLPVYKSTGGRTKYNRLEFGIPKTHALDAVCVGDVMGVKNWKRKTLVVSCDGRGRYSRTTLDKNGFPKLYLLRKKYAFGFATGDYVLVNKPKYRNNPACTFTGRVTVRQNGGFSVDVNGVAKGASYRACVLLQRSDGYRYRLRRLDEATTPNFINI